MAVIDIKQLECSKSKIIKRIIGGAVFIHATDTIYGLACDATNVDAVKRLRSIKQLPDYKPVSVTAPGKSWVHDNCYIDKNAEDWLAKLPGAFTLIFRLKNHDCVAGNVSGNDTLGVRIPDHWISKFCEELGRPLVTTSANVSGRPNMTCLDDLDEDIKKKVDFVVYEGKLVGRASTIVDLSSDKVNVIKR